MLYHNKRMFQILPGVSTIMSLYALSQQKDVPDFTGCVDNGEPELDSLFFDLHRRLFDFRRPFDPVVHRRNFPVRVEICKLTENVELLL